MGLSSGHPSIPRAAALAALFFILVSVAIGQQTRVLAPHKEIAHRVPKSLEHHELGTSRSMVGGFWTIDANRKASIYLRNGLNESGIVVSPVIYLSNGTALDLAAITLDPSGTAVISINDALQQKGISPVATLSGYVEIKYTAAWDPLCVTVTSTDPIHSVIFTSSLQPSLSASLPIHLSKPKLGNMYAVDGMWWKSQSDVTGFVGLSNTTAAPVDATVKMSDKSGNQVGEYSIRVSPHGTKTIILDALNTMPAASAGGLRILHSGTMEGLLISAGLESTSSGYSANIPFHYAFNIAPRKATSEDYAELGLMAGPADPMMRFPADTVFAPFSVVRNVSDQPVSVSPSIYWMEGGLAKAAKLQSFSLLPSETRVIDMASLLRSAGLNTFAGSFNLILSTQGKPHSLLLASGSVDQKNTYVFQILPHRVVESNAKTISYWSTGNGDDTMVTVWNPADEPQDFAFTLFFKGGNYRLAMHLEARATRTFNISEIIQNQIPDEQGNIIPANIQEGSAKISGIHAENEEILVAVDAGTYNVRKATCSYYCISCDGAVAAFIGIAPFTMAQGSTNQLYFQIKTNTGGEYNSSGTWGSSKTAVATVNASSGLVNGVSPGSTSITAYDDFIDVYDSSYCNYDPECPVQGYQSGTGTGNVGPPIKITNVSPSNLVLGGSGSMTISGSGFSSYPGTPTINFDGAGIAVPTATVINDSTIQANYAVNCSGSSQNLQVTFPSADSGTAQSNWWPISVASPAAPAPKIMFNGSDATGTTQSVAVGQQIALSASIPSLPACTSVASQTWSTPPGTAVGGYTANSSSGVVTSISTVNTNAQSYTFYWVDNGSTRKMTYHYTLNTGATSPTATVTFNVVGPTSPTVAVAVPGRTVISNLTDSNNKPLKVLSFGTLEGTFPTAVDASVEGITFDGSANEPSGYSNAKFQWVQIVNSSTSKFIAGTTTTCPASGLDNQYPYSKLTGTSDAPGFGLASGNTEQTITTSYTMYFMWNSGLANAIPIALGHVDWTWTADAKQTSGVWSIISGSGGPTNTSQPFTVSSYFPRWTSQVLNGNCSGT